MAPRNARGTGGRDGFSTLQILIVAALVAMVLAVALPAFAARARQSALRQNAHSLELELKSYLALDLDRTYLADDAAVAEVAAAADTTVSADAPGTQNACRVFSLALRGPHGYRSAYYVNPFDGSRTVVCRSALPTAGDDTPPAVWITDDRRYSYRAFTPSLETTRRLRGTLVVVFLSHDGHTSCIEVYYVDGSGERSPTASALAI